MLGHLFPDLLEETHLDEPALAGVTGADAPWLDPLDGPERLHRVGDRDLHRSRYLLDRELEIAVVVQVPDDVFGDRMQSRGQQDAGVPREVFGERLLGLRADDRVELALLFVPLHEARALEWLGLGVRAFLVPAVTAPVTIDADPLRTRVSGERTGPHLLKARVPIPVLSLLDPLLPSDG